jgi:Tol biopolymer transport system component
MYFKGFSIRSVAAIAALPAWVAAGAVHAQSYTSWNPATPVVEVNSPAADGCPIESPDGLSLYIASMRTGTLGGNDIWVADRTSKGAPWGEPQNLGMPVNSLAADFCPTPLHGNYLMYVSERPGAETCNAGPGSGDIYVIRRNPAFGWGEPQHLGCVENGTGPNSAAAEFSPSLVETGAGTFLYFSSTSSGNMDIYVSQLGADGRFGAPTPVHELNTVFDDRMPNVRKDGREVVFSSTRPTDANGTATFGGQDVYVSTRGSTSEPWSAPVNLGSSINTAGSETRSSLSWDGRRLYFGRDGEIYSTSREKVTSP